LWFSSKGPPGTGEPTQIQAIKGAAALGGLYKKQRWSKFGSFAIP